MKVVAICNINIYKNISGGFITFDSPWIAYKVMSPVAIALDNLQGAEHCYLGLLMTTVQLVRRKLVDMQPGVTHSGTLVEGPIDSINRRFAHLFEYNSSSSVFAAAAVAHPNFKLRWVPPEKKEWAKNIFIAEAKKYVSPSLSEQNSVQQESSTSDTFYDYDDNIHDSENRCSDAEVTIECLRYLEDGYSA